VLGELKSTQIDLEVCDLNLENCLIYQPVVSSKGTIGISYPLNYEVKLTYNGWEKPFAGFLHSFNWMKLSYIGLMDIFKTAKETGNYDEAAATVSGPVGLYVVVDTFKQYGFWPIFSLLGDLSMTLVIMNLLPIPALDGGRVLIILVELIRGKPLNKKLEAAIIQISFILMLILMLVIVIKDIVYIDLLKGILGV
jgi:RIP metalloprotease RseP